MAMLNNQRVNLHFSMVFLWFSYGFPNGCPSQPQPTRCSHRHCRMPQGFFVASPLGAAKLNKAGAGGAADGGEEAAAAWQRWRYPVLYGCV